MENIEVINQSAAGLKVHHFIAGKHLEVKHQKDNIVYDASKGLTITHKKLLKSTVDHIPLKDIYEERPPIVSFVDKHEEPGVKRCTLVVNYYNGRNWKSFYSKQMPENMAIQVAKSLNNIFNTFKLDA